MDYALHHMALEPEAKSETETTKEPMGMVCLCFLILDFVFLRFMRTRRLRSGAFPFFTGISSRGSSLASALMGLVYYKLKT